MIYTLRKAGDPERPLYELTKWDPAYTRPLDVYVQWITFNGGESKVMSCNCPSRSNPCKHVPMSTALLDAIENHDDLPFVYWDADNGKVKNAGDI
jgi:hypothetical protein